MQPGLDAFCLWVFPSPLMFPSSMSGKYLSLSLPTPTQDLEWISTKAPSQPWDAAQSLQMIHTSSMNTRFKWIESHQLPTLLPTL